jgi:predicted RNase H-like HicB family nuclease
MTVKTIAKAQPTFPFEAYSHIVSPIDSADGGGFMFTMPDIPGVMADGATELEAIADGREAFMACVSAMVDMGQEIPAPPCKKSFRTYCTLSKPVVYYIQGDTVSLQRGERDELDCIRVGS